jgi:opacity protein-like surface antigen
VNIGRSDDAVYAMNALNNGEWYMENPLRRNDHFNTFLANASKSVSEYNETNISKVDMSHKQPLSLGLGVGYALNNRWSVQSGLVYSLLISEWKTALDYPDKYKQQLHFVGIPLGMNYKIAEWHRLRFYASAGGMAEWNVGGNIKSRYYYFEDDAYRTEKESIRMKEMQWSVNGRVGASYPVVRFVNAYIEGGANYYFKNNSSIETIRSDKPFHVSLQAGLRFGF